MHAARVVVVTGRYDNAEEVLGVYTDLAAARAAVKANKAYAKANDQLYAEDVFYQTVKINAELL